MPEVSLTADMSDDQFIASLYRDLLRREPKIHELRHWRNALASGTKRTEVVETFMTSSEYANLKQQNERFGISSVVEHDVSERERQILAALQSRVIRKQFPDLYAGRLPAQTSQAPPVPAVLRNETTDHLAAGLVRPSFVPARHAVDTESLANLSYEVWNAQEAVGTLNPRSGGFANRIVQFGKKLLQRSLSWYTRSLQVFSQTTAKALEEHGHAISAIDNQVQEYISELRAEVMKLHDEARIHKAELANQRDELHRQEQERRKQDDQLLQQASEIIRQDNELVKIRLQSVEPYVRAAELATRETLTPYVGYFREASLVADLGCGRGEFLELLKEAGVPSYGVDSDKDICESVTRKGLRVFQEDVFHHLSEVAERSLGGIFSARLLEFLPVHEQAKLIAMSSSKLKPGGVLLIETTNPDSVYGFGRISNLDPTHVRPVAPALLAAMFESSVLRDVAVLNPHGFDTKLTQTRESDRLEVNGKLMPAGSAYAVVGWRK